MAPLGGCDFISRFGPHPSQFGPHGFEVGFEGEDPLHARQVQALGGERGDAAEAV